MIRIPNIDPIIQAFVDFITEKPDNFAIAILLIIGILVISGIIAYKLIFDS